MARIRAWRRGLGVVLLAVGAGAMWAAPVAAQRARHAARHGARRSALSARGDVVYDSTLFDAMRYRLIGPFRGGRSTTVTGVASKPRVFYMGATGGGVWKTTDYGEVWHNVSDGYFGGSIGAVAVAPSDPDVVYVGTGSAEIRGNVSAGRGAWRSTDGGRTWTFIGLRDAGQFSRIVVDPRDPERVFAAVLGHAFGPNPERGVFRSEDGGRTWKKVLFVDDTTGAIDLAMDPTNPRILFAGMWRGERRPWTMIDGSKSGGIYRTMDGGDTWTKLTKGLPTGLMGKIGVSVSGADPQRVYALITARADTGGVYRSDDGGDTWVHINDQHELRQRGWYYSRIYADPQNPDLVYALNTGLYQSVDGGRTFSPMRVVHGDTHDLWINPQDPRDLILADDGGAQVTVDRGRTWSTMMNQPTAQFYRVTVDNEFPYRVFGAQQDNTTISVPAWSSRGITPKQHWYSMGGGESGYIAVDPRDPSITYAGAFCCGGWIDYANQKTGQVRDVVVYPQVKNGMAAKNLKYRFQWNAPILISRHDPNVIYHAAQMVLKSTDGGEHWRAISPDLTRNDKAKEDYAGGPIQHEETGVEVYGTVFALAESPFDSLTLWAGSDDGLVHITRDGGAHWTDITPKGLPTITTINVIAPSPHVRGKAYLTAYRYRMDDFTPYVYKTTDYGAHWTRIADGTHGIPANDPVRVVREDPNRPGLLYAGTEYGLYISFDDGARWQPFQLNLPIVPVTDLKVHGTDLVVATQGRSFWILDDLTPLYQLGSAAAAEHFLFKPRDAYRTPIASYRTAEHADPTPPPAGAVIYYDLKQAPTAPVSLQILDAQGRLVRAFSSNAAQARALGDVQRSFGGSRLMVAPAHVGMNRFIWDMNYPGVRRLAGEAVWDFNGELKAPPGDYAVRISIGSWSQTQPFRILKDPRLTNVTIADLQRQFELAKAVRDTMNRLYDVERDVRSARTQVNAIRQHVGGLGAGNAAVAAQVTAAADSLVQHLGSVEDTLIQTENRAGEDPVMFPPKMDNRFAAVFTYIEGANAGPTVGASNAFRDDNAEWGAVQGLIQRVLDEEVPAFNAKLKALGVPGVILPHRKKPVTTALAPAAGGGAGIGRPR